MSKGVIALYAIVSVFSVTESAGSNGPATMTIVIFATGPIAGYYLGESTISI